MATRGIRRVLGKAEPLAQPGSGFAFAAQQHPGTLWCWCRAARLRPPHGTTVSPAPPARPGHPCPAGITPRERCASVLQGHTAAQSWERDGDGACTQVHQTPRATQPHLTPGPAAALHHSSLLPDPIKLGGEKGSTCMEPAELPLPAPRPGKCCGRHVVSPHIVSLVLRLSRALTARSPQGIRALSSAPAPVPALGPAGWLQPEGGGETLWPSAP